MKSARNFKLADIVVPLMMCLIVMALYGCGSARASDAIYGYVSLIGFDGREIENRENVVVFIDGVKALDTQAQVSKISHRGQQFSPAVLPIQVGDGVDFFNDDAIYHNAFSLSQVQPFDLGVFSLGVSKIVTFDRLGLVTLYCNLHPNMVSNILVLPNRYYAVTRPDGFYRIENLPSRDLMLRVWYEFSDDEYQKVSLEKGHQSIQVNFNLTVTKKRIDHLNKFGKPYRKKY